MDCAPLPIDEGCWLDEKTSISQANPENPGCMGISSQAVFADSGVKVMDSYLNREIACTKSNQNDPRPCGFIKSCRILDAKPCPSNSGI